MLEIKNLHARIAEDGTIPPVYRLTETPTADYAERTERNVIDSDATLVLFWQAIRGGSLLTERMARKHRRPCLAVDLSQPEDLAAVREWLNANGIAVLNVAGPRESNAPELSPVAEHFLLRLLES